MIENWAVGGTRFEAKAARTISGPIPAWSPSVIPTRQLIAHCHKEEPMPQGLLVGAET
jgi:hypothetical protein